MEHTEKIGENHFKNTLSQKSSYYQQAQKV